jgi:hypothetical protein
VELCEYFNQKPIVFSEALFMGHKQFTLGLDEAKDKDYKAIIYDEAGDFDKASYMSQVNKLINRVFDTFRSTNVIIILVLPSFFRLPDSLYEKGLPRILFHVQDRTTYGRFYVYDMYTQATMRDWAKKQGIGYRMKLYQYIERNFDGKFTDLSPERSKELSDYCDRHKKGIRRDTAVNLSGLKDFAALAVEFGVSIHTMRNRVSLLGLKPSYSYRNKAYFDDNAVNVIKSKGGWRKRGKKND